MTARLSPLRLALALATLAFAIRLTGLSVRPLWLDEAYSAWFSARSWEYLWAVVPTYEPHPPFYYSLLKTWRMLFGGDPFALRFLSLLFATLTIPVVVTIALELERQRPSGRPLIAAGTAAFLASCSPFLVFLGQEARPYPLLIFAYAVATLAVLRLGATFRGGEAGHWRWWLLLAAATEVTLWAHGIGALYALCIAIALAPAWLARPIPRARLVRGMGTAAAVALAFTPCLAMMLGRTGDWGTGWLRWEPIMLVQLFTLYSVPFEYVTVGSTIAATAMLLLVKRGIHGALTKSIWDSEKALLILWLGPTLIALAISLAALPVFLPRALAGTLIPAYVLMGAAVARSGSRRERLAIAAALALLVPTTVQVAHRQPAEDWRQLGTFLQRNVGPRDQVWLYPNDSALPLNEAVPQALTRARGIPGDYPATAHKGPIRAGSPAVVSLTRPQAQRIADDAALRPVPTIWLVRRQSEIFDPDGDVPAALARVRRPGRVVEWGYLEVRPYHTP